MHFEKYAVGLEIEYDLYVVFIYILGGQYWYV